MSSCRRDLTTGVKQNGSKGGARGWQGGDGEGGLGVSNYVRCLTNAGGTLLVDGGHNSEEEAYDGGQNKVVLHTWVVQSVT